MRRGAFASGASVRGRGSGPRPRPSTKRAVGQAELRAVRAAALGAPREPWLPPGFGRWVLARLVAMLLLVGAAWLVYDCASSERFAVRSIQLDGTVLLSRADVESVAAVAGSNIFWVDREQLAARLRSLPLVQRVSIETALPDTVQIRIVERQPVAFWISGDRSYLVDREGVILKAVDAESQQARACAGQPCDPRLAPLPTVAQRDGPPLAPGDRVESQALATAARLATLLPAVGIEPLAFEWGHDTGLEVPTRDGWRARFDDSGDLDRQVSALSAIRDQLARSQTAAQLIDVRFGDRPYYR